MAFDMQDLRQISINVEESVKFAVADTHLRLVCKSYTDSGIV